MRRHPYVLATAALLLAACDQAQDPTNVVPEEFAFAAVTVPDVAIHNVIACKEGLGGTFNFTVSGTASVSFPSGTSFTLVDDECKTVAVSSSGAQSATVTEVVATLPANTQFDSVVSYVFTPGGGSGNSGTPSRVGVSTNPAATAFPLGNDHGWVLVFYNTFSPPPPPPPPGVGRMTGGGFQIVGNVRITRGFTIHCDLTLSNNLEINWPDNKWHIDKPLTDAQCIDDPAIDPTQPAAPFDTFIGEGVGELNGVAGSIVRFTFIDAGEPGTDDQARIQIWDAGGTLVLDVPLSNLDHGNIQAHYDQPHGNKPTS